jgi:hypothetical protein
MKELGVGKLGGLVVAWFEWETARCKNGNMGYRRAATVHHNFCISTTFTLVSQWCLKYLIDIYPEQIGDFLLHLNKPNLFIEVFFFFQFVLKDKMLNNLSLIIYCTVPQYLFSITCCGCEGRQRQGRQVLKTSKYNFFIFFLFWRRTDLILFKNLL